MEASLLANERKARSGLKLPVCSGAANLRKQPLTRSGLSLSASTGDRSGMTWDDVLAIGLRLPGVEASISYGTPALKVRGKLVTRLRPEDDSLVLLSVPPDEREMLMEMDPRVFHVTPHYQGFPAVLARLVPLEPERLESFLVRRWREVAPRRIVARFEAGQVGSQ